MGYAKEDLEKLLQYGPSGSNAEARALATQLLSAITTIERLEVKANVKEMSTLERWEQSAINSGLSPIEAKVAAIIYDNWPADRNTYASAAQIVKTFGLDKQGDVTEEDVITNGISTLARKVSKTAHEHGWWSDKDGKTVERNMGEMMMLMVCEVAEGMEAWRDGEPDLWYQYLNSTTKYDVHERYAEDVYVGDANEGELVLGKPCGVATEFADVIIRILDTCETMDIPVAEAIVRKMAYNETRPYRHGGKLA